MVAAGCVLLAAGACSSGSSHSLQAHSRRPATTRARRGGLRPVEQVWIPKAVETSPSDPPSPIASEPTRLYPLPAIAKRACAQAQATTTKPLLCPTLVPRPRLPGFPGGRFGQWLFKTGPDGIDMSYGGPWEQRSGRGWREHLWRNRPCCFFHFTIQHPIPDNPVPGERPAVVGGYRGELAPANGVGGYFGNHVRFFFTRDGVRWVATLHSFGRGTRLLLSAIVRSLRPIHQ